MLASTRPEFADTELANDVSLLPIGLKQTTEYLSPFPDPEFEERLRRKRRAAELKQQLLRTADETRLATASAMAFANGKLYGRDEGFKEGYRKGTHWGMFCGAVIALVLGAVTVFGGAIVVAFTRPPF